MPAAGLAVAGEPGPKLDDDSAEGLRAQEDSEHRKRSDLDAQGNEDKTG